MIGPSLADSMSVSPMHADPKVALSFTGGKDSSLVLHILQLQSAAGARVGPEAAKLRAIIPEPLTAFHSHTVECLVTFVPKNALRPFKAHPLALVSAQAAALNIPHKVCEVGEPYLDSYQSHIRALREEFGVSLLATGDIEDVCSGFMHKAVAGTGVQLCKPLWQLPRSSILDLTWKLGLRPVISCTHIPKFATTSPALLQHCRALLLPADPTPLDTLNNSAPGSEAPRADILHKSTGHPTQPEQLQLGTTACGTSPLLTVRGTTPSLKVTGALLSAPVVAGAPCSAAAGLGRQQAELANKASPLASVAAGEQEQGMAVASCEIAEWLVGAELGPPVHEALLRPLGTLGVDAGGEYGEYHTMVLDGPLFERSVRVEAVRKVEEEYCFLEVQGVQLVDK